MNDKNKEQLALVKRDVVDVVTERINQLVGSGHLHLPEDYSVENSLLAWWLALQTCQDKDKRPALQVCTKNSIANATLDLVIQGLSPSKKQCYPVVYGDQLVCQRSYFGDEALLRRARKGVEHVRAQVYYVGDRLEWEIVRGQRYINKHLQSEENIGGLDKIRGCYVVISDKEENVIHCERMTIDQIKSSWEKSKTYDGKRNTFHITFSEEAAKRTVIRRACKRLINSSNDSYLVKAVERQNHMAAEAEMEARVTEEANQDVIDIPAETETEDHEQKGVEHAAGGGKAAPTPPDGETEEDSPSSPAARFTDYVNEHGLNEKKARKVAAAMRNLDDARKLSNDDYEAVLSNAAAFKASYRQQHGGGQEAFDGPGF